MRRSAREQVWRLDAGRAVHAETVVTACAMIRAADLNLFDIAMWFQRPVGRS